MNLCQTKSCFVCNRDVDGSGVLLSLETTSYSKTAFPTKLMQLLGDSFMVVILEDDKMCSRCANLINQTDKLEQDLRHIKSIIMGFLNEKYDLNREDEKLSSPLEEFQDPKEKNVFENQNLMQSPTIIVRHVDGETYQPNNSSKDIEESSGSNSVGENPFDCRINSEPVLNYNQNLIHNGSHNISGNSNQTMSVSLLNKSSEHGHREKHSSLKSCSCKSNQTFQDVNNTVGLKEQIKKNLSEDYIGDGTMTSLTHTNNHHITITETSGKSVVILKSEQSRSDEIQSKMEFLCKDSSIFEDLKDIFSSEIVPDIELPYGITRLLSETIIQSELSNITGKNWNASKGQTLSAEIAKQSNCKYIQKERTDNIVKKLSFPSASNIKRGLSPFFLNQNSNYSVSNKVLNNHPKCNKSIKSEVETNLNPSVTEETDKISSTSEIPLICDLNTHCKICNKYFTESKAYRNHKKEHLKDTKSVKCRFCMKSFKSNSSLKCHEAVHTGKYSYYCEFCGRGFSRVDKFNEHLSKHTKEERFICDVCGKKFHFHASYWIHRKWHDNPFPYKCNVCEKPFKHSSNLATHRRRKHMKERPYKCSYCSLAFKVSSSLKKHLVQHTKQYPYKCGMCDKGFTVRSRYTEHLARKHDTFVEKPSVVLGDYKMVVYDDAGEETQAES